MTVQNDHMRQSIGCKQLMEAKLSEISAYIIMGNIEMAEMRADEAKALLDAHIKALILHTKAAVDDARKGGAR